MAFVGTASGNVTVTVPVAGPAGMPNPLRLSAKRTGFTGT